MVTFPEGMSHEFASLRHRPDAAAVPDNGRELARRRRSLADGHRPSVDPLTTWAHGALSTAATDVVGRAIWESAARASRLGASIALVQDDNGGAPLHGRPVRGVVSAWLAGLSVSVILLFLISVE
jgi:hypothetical protein